MDSASKPNKKPVLESIVDSSKDVAEVILDQSLNNGILKDLPVIGTAISLFKTGNSIKEYIFTKKLSIFLSSCDTVSDKERKEYNAKIENDPNFREKVGTQLSLFIDQSDTIDKSVLLAKTFSAFLKSQITYNQFLDLSVLVNAIKHSMIEEMCTVLFYLSSERFYNLKIFQYMESLLEITNLLERDILIISESRVNHQYIDNSKFSRDESRKLNITFEDIYKVTKLGVMFITYVVPDTYQLVREKISSNPDLGFIKEGYKVL